MYVLHRYLSIVCTYQRGHPSICHIPLFPKPRYIYTSEKCSQSRVIKPCTNIQVLVATLPKLHLSVAVVHSEPNTQLVTPLSSPHQQLQQPPALTYPTAPSSRLSPFPSLYSPSTGQHHHPLSPPFHLHPHHHHHISSLSLLLPP